MLRPQQIPGICKKLGITPARGSFAWVVPHETCKTCRRVEMEILGILCAAVTSLDTAFTIGKESMEPRKDFARILGIKDPYAIGLMSGWNSMSPNFDDARELLPGWHVPHSSDKKEFESGYKFGLTSWLECIAKGIAKMEAA